MNDYIYLVVAQTGTRVAKFFKLITGKPYNHVSLASDIDLCNMYSFCRTYSPFPFPATFNQEIVGKGTLGKYGYIPCEIYRIPVTPEQKAEYNAVINHFAENRNIYSYNVLGLLAIYLNIEWNRKKNFLCSQFVAYTMDRIGIRLQKPFCLYTPDDFRDFPDATLIYKGELNNFFYSMQSKLVSQRN